MTRGIANKNPGNLRKSATAWQGLADTQGDPEFFTFKTPQFGIRALAKTLLTYHNQYGLDTIRKVISRWAPPNENNTDAYVVAVCAGVGVGPDVPLDFDNSAVMVKLVSAIILHENGTNPYADSVIRDALNSAGVSDAAPAPLHKQPAFLAKVGTGAAGLAAGAATYAPTVKGWADQLGAFDGSPMAAHIKSALLTIGAGLLVLGIAADVLKHRNAA